MARVCRPGAVIAVRDVDYAATSWFPADPGLDRWLELYSGSPAATAPSPTPDGGCCRGRMRRGCGTSSPPRPSCFATPDEREWWGTSWAGRATASCFAEQAVAYGLATTAELEEIAAAWLRWAARRRRLARHAAPRRSSRCSSRCPSAIRVRLDGRCTRSCGGRSRRVAALGRRRRRLARHAARRAAHPRLSRDLRTRGHQRLMTTNSQGSSSPGVTALAGGVGLAGRRSRTAPGPGAIAS